MKIRISTSKAKIGQPVMFISAVETLQLSEVEQHEIMTGVIETEKNTVDGYLNDHTPVPLMKPNTTYIMSVNYTIQKIRKGQLLGIESHTQNFAFKTDALPPKELKPYVLGATPEMDERFHFYEDALKIVFNDASFLAMLEAYGKQIRAIIRGADGVPVGNSPEIVSSLEDIPATVLSAYRDTIHTLIDKGLLPCLGAITMPSHAAYTTPFKLKPLMAYTFDLEFDEEDTTPETESRIPFYRRGFSTSRFANLKDFVKEIRSGVIYHKALKNEIIGLPLPGSGQKFVTVTDIEFENAMSAAGIMQRDDLTQTTSTLLWSNHAGDFLPYGLLIESSEPVWRMRTEADKVVVKNQQNQVVDPAFEVVQNISVQAMLLREEAGHQIIHHFVKSSGGTRTLVFFKDIVWPEAGKTISIELVQTASDLYALPEKVEKIYNLIVTSKAPWEE